MNKHQGSTLVIVLVILVLITLIGTMAVRTGIFGLRLATNSQIQALLLESTNAALFNLEDPDQIERQMAGDGMYSYFESAHNANDELVFCYRASQRQFFSMQNASSITQDGNFNKIGITGFCKANQYATGRSAVLTQVYLNKNIMGEGQLFEHVPKGTSLGASTNNIPVVNNSISATVISVLPSFSSATDTNIENCFKRRKAEVSQCFRELNIPFNTQHADYIVGSQPKLVS
jgi:hypothetical protein